MRLSVVVIVYNEERRIAALLAALCAQAADAPFEIVVVDGASSDSTARIVARCAEGDSRIRLLRLDRRGYALQRNLGAREARGEYLLFLSADVTITAGLVRKYLIAADAGYDIVQGTAVDVSDGRSRFRGAFCRFKTFLYGLAPQVTMGEVSTINMLVRRALVLASPFDEDLPALEDKAFFLRVAAGVRYRRLRTAVVYHDFHEGVWRQWRKQYWEAVAVGMLCARHAGRVPFRALNVFNWLRAALLSVVACAAALAIAIWRAPHAPGIALGAVAVVWFGCALTSTAGFAWRADGDRALCRILWPLFAVHYLSSIACGLGAGLVLGLRAKSG